MSSILLKLNVNEDNFPSDQTKIAYIYSRRGPSCQAHLHCWLYNGRLNFGSLKQIMDLLDTLFDDSNRFQDAINRLHSNSQRNKPFSSWIAEIHRDTAMAGYDSQSQTLRDLVLSNINSEISQVLTYDREISQMNFDEVVGRLKDIDNRVRSFAKLSAHRYLGRLNLETVDQPIAASQGQSMEPMDLSTASLRPRRPLT